jgi:hypothetical protein
MWIKYLTHKYIINESALVHVPEFPEPSSSAHNPVGIVVVSKCCYTALHGPISFVHYLCCRGIIMIWGGGGERGSRGDRKPSVG